jgi:hypothetical protein
MMQTLKINDKTYFAKDLEAFKLTIGEIGNLKLCEMPTHARVRILGLKIVDGVTFQMEAKAQNNEDGIFHQIGFTIDFVDRNKSNGRRRLEAIRQHFKQLPKTWQIFDISQWEGFHNHWGTSYWLNSKYIKEDKPIIDQFQTVLKIIKKFKTSRLRAFLCHSSTDKEVVEKFGIRLKSKGSIVWLDKWEIKVGDSIVEKIDNGLEEMTHLLLFLSKSSVNKPWVKKEFSVGLMRKLSNNSVKVIPVLLDKVELPMIIRDIKYADCISRNDKCFDELIEALMDT